MFLRCPARIGNRGNADVPDRAGHRPRRLVVLPEEVEVPA
jgi:hypothetical protein